MGARRLAVPRDLVRRGRQRYANASAEYRHSRGQPDQPQARAGKAHHDLQSGVLARASNLSTGGIAGRLHGARKQAGEKRQEARKRLSLLAL
jgi:hypothetical protein